MTQPTRTELLKCIALMADSKELVGILARDLLRRDQEYFASLNIDPMFLKGKGKN